MTSNKTSEQLISEVMDLVHEYAAMQFVEPYGKQIDAADAIEDKVREILQEYSKDSERLLFSCEFDGYTTVEKDRYDYAIDCMEENGRDEPNKEDELNGLRRLIDAAMEVKNSEA
jgi:hypothetical protein